MAENLTSTPVVAVSSQISSQPANVAGAVNEALDIERRQMNLVMSRIPESVYYLLESNCRFYRRTLF